MTETPQSGNGPETSLSLDDQVQRELNAALAGRSIEQLMAQTACADEPASTPETGDTAGSVPSHEGREHVIHQTRRGRIVAIQGDDVFVDLTGLEAKNQGIVPLKQFDRAPGVGSIMDFVVERFDEREGLFILAREGAAGLATWEQLQRGMVVEARVVATNKGGLELEMVGGVRAFMPAGQIDLRHVDDLEALVGQKLQALVQSIERRAKHVVLSRRNLLEQRRAAAGHKFWGEIEVGQVREGTVQSITEYGAFVSLGPVDGLLHISDMSYGHVEKPEDVVSLEQTIQVKVLKLDRESKRISLGLKQMAPDPWEGLAARLKSGDQVTGCVARTVPFGAFVELEDGVHGLLPLGEMSWGRVHHATDVVKEGDVLRLVVLQIDAEKRRLSLSLKQAAGDPWTGAASEYAKNSLVEGTVIGVSKFGAFCELEPGVEGLVHISELSDRRVKDVEDVLKVGDRRQFRVLDLDPTQHRIRLSLRAVERSGKESIDAETPQVESDQHDQSLRKPQPKKSTQRLKGGIGEVDGLGLRDLRGINL